MPGKKVEVDVERAKELYYKYDCNSTRAALSYGCSRSSFIRILQKNNVLMKEYKPGEFKPKWY